MWWAISGKHFNMSILNHAHDFSFAFDCSVKNCEYASFIVVSPVIQVNVCLLYVVPVQTSKPELCLIKQDLSVSMLALGLNVSFGW